MRLALAAILAVAASAALGPASASAQPICGQALTSNTTLEADLDCTGQPGPALVIGAPDITFDLAGHSLSGTSNAVLNEGHDRVTIRNGSVAANEGPPVFLRGSARNEIRELTVTGLNSGIWLSDSDRNRIAANHVLGSIRLSDGSNRNTVAANHWPAGEDGLVLTESSDNRVVRNAFDGVDGSPIALDAAHRNWIAHNTVRSLYNGISLRSSHGNDLVDNFIGPAASFPAQGPELRDSSRNLLLRNTIVGTFLGARVVSGQGNALWGNLVVAGTPYDFNPSEPDGIRVEAAAAATALVRNTAVSFPDDGIDVESPATFLERNRANDNGDLGIEAVAAAIDGGGNRARGNGNPAQCVNVSCR